MQGGAREAEQAVKYYRERYTVTGIFENHPYEGIEKLLQNLKEKGYAVRCLIRMPDSMVHIVLEHFQFSDSYFDVILGSDINQPKMTKAEVIEQVLREVGYEEKKEKVVMIGDRSHDAEGAKQAGIVCLGC